MRKLPRIILSAAVIAGLSVPLAAGASTHHATHPPTYVLRNRHSRCYSGYRKVTLHVLRRERVKVHEHWRLERRRVRVVGCEREPLKVTLTAPTTTTTMAPAPTIASPTTTTPATVVRAVIDPSWTLGVTTPQAPPVPVTFIYSAAAAGTTTVPGGTLTLNVVVHGSQTAVGGCASNVGGTTIAATCQVSVPAWGQYDLQVTYATNSPNVIPSTATTTEDIEPPALPSLTNAETWGTTSPTNGPTIAAVVSADSTTDAVTLTDPSFEGATSVTLTDNLGHECAASVSGTSASCTMPNSATPTSFTVGYPGGTSTTTTETASPWGKPESQTVTTTWNSQTVHVWNPSVTAPSTTHVTDTISAIDALGGFSCGIPNPNSYNCAEMGVEWTGPDSPPQGGTVTLTATATNPSHANTETASCVVNLASATTCAALFDSETGTVNLTSGQWSIAASYSGFDNGAYNAIDWAPTSSTATMVTASSGHWYDYQG